MTHTAASGSGQHRLPPLRSTPRSRSGHTTATRAPSPLTRQEPQLGPIRAGGHDVPLRGAQAPPRSRPHADATAPTDAPSVSRHPWEWPLTAAAVLVTAAALATAVHTLVTAQGAVFLWTAALVLAGVPGGCWASSGLRHARQRAQSVRISPTQFPEADHTIRRLSADMGLSRTPDAYVCPASGGQRAWATGHGRRGYVVVPSDLFEAGGRLRDSDALRFVVAHQLGHIAAGHASFWLRASTALGRLVPVLGSSLSRAAEYTADDHAHAHCPEGVHAIRLLAGGTRLYAQVNMSEMAERARTDQGPFLLLYNLLSSRPANTKRMAALRDRTRPGRVFL